MTIYAWPSTVVPNDMSVEFSSNAARNFSPFTGTPRGIGRDAELLRVSMSFRFLRSASQSLGAAADENTRSTLMGFLAKVSGPEHRIQLPMFARNNLGSWGGTPLVAGANQTGKLLNIDASGQGTSSAYAFAGDWFTVNGELKIVTDTASITSDAATLSIWPPLRSSPDDNAAIDHTTPTGIFMLERDPVFLNAPGPSAFPFADTSLLLIEDPYQ